MEVSPSDLKLPQAVIMRLIKDALPDGVVVSKEAKTAIARAAAIFVLHATTFASENAQSKNRKNISSDDVLHAIKALECEELEKPVREALEAFKTHKEQRIPQKKVASKDKEPEAGASTILNDDNEDGIGVIET